MTFEPPGEAVICGQENRAGDGLGTRLSSVCIDSNTQKWTSSLVTTLVAMTTADVTFIGTIGGHDSCYCHTFVDILMVVTTGSYVVLALEMKYLYIAIFIT